MFKRGLDKNDAWEGVVTDKVRSSPDGQNMYHRVVVTLSDGNVKEIRVRRRLWNGLSPGDRLFKRSGQTAPTKIA
jgi:hypothetical protein